MPTVSFENSCSPGFPGSRSAGFSINSVSVVLAITGAVAAGAVPGLSSLNEFDGETDCVTKPIIVLTASQRMRQLEESISNAEQGRPAVDCE